MKATLLFTCLLFFSFQYPQQVQPAVELYGVIVNADTGLPISNAHVYVLSGEEEALTDKKGAFKFVSWQQLPVVLTVKHQAYEVKKITVSDASKPILIKLIIK
jgi:hypothetical protein